MGKLHDEKDLSRRKGLKERKQKPAEFQSNILGSSIREQNQRRERKNFRLIREAQRRDKEARGKPEEIKLFGIRSKAIAEQMINTPYRKWSAKLVTQAKKIFPSETFRKLVQASEEKHKVK